MEQGAGLSSLLDSLKLSQTPEERTASVATFFGSAGNLNDLNDRYSHEDIVQLLVALTEAGFQLHYQSEFTKRVLLRIASVAQDVPATALPSFLHTVTTLLNLSVTPLITQRILQGRVREVLSSVEELSAALNDDGQTDDDENNIITASARNKVELRDFYLRNVFNRSYQSMSLACRQEDQAKHDWETSRIKYNDIVPPEVAKELDRLEASYPDKRAAFDESDDEDERPQEQFKRELQELRLATREYNVYEDPEAKDEDELAYQIHKRVYQKVEEVSDELTTEYIRQTERMLQQREKQHPDAKTDKTQFALLHELDQAGLAEEGFFSLLEGNTTEKTEQEWQRLRDEVNALKAKNEQLNSHEQHRIKELYEELVVAGRHQQVSDSTANEEEVEERQLAGARIRLEQPDPLEVSAAYIDALKANAAGLQLRTAADGAQMSRREIEQEQVLHHISDHNLKVPFRRPAGSQDFVDREGRDSFMLKEIKHQFGQGEDDDALVERLLEGRDESVFADPRTNEEAYYLTEDDEQDQNVHQELGLFMHIAEQVAFARPVDRKQSEEAFASMIETLHKEGNLSSVATHDSFDTAVAMLGRRVVAVKEQLSPADMLTTLQAFVLLVYPEDDVTTDLVRRLVAAGDKLSYAQTADLLGVIANVPFLKSPGDWAFGSLENWSATLTNLSGKLAGEGLATASAASIALATYAFGQLRFRPAERKLVAICDEMARKIATVEGSTAALFLAGMKALKFSPPPELLDSLLVAAVKDVEQLSFSDVTSVLSALASCHYDVHLSPTDLITPLLERAGRTYDYNGAGTQPTELIEEFSAACRFLGVMPTVNLELPFLQATLSNQSNLDRLFTPQRQLKNLIWERRLLTNEDYVQRMQEYHSQ